MKLAALLVFLLAPLAGCGPRPPAADYTAEGLICVDRSNTRAELNVCRCDLEKRYARPPLHCAPTPQDGGAS